MGRGLVKDPGHGKQEEEGNLFMPITELWGSSFTVTRRMSMKVRERSPAIKGTSPWLGDEVFTQRCCCPLCDGPRPWQSGGVIVEKDGGVRMLPQCWDIKRILWDNSRQGGGGGGRCKRPSAAAVSAQKSIHGEQSQSPFIPLCRL